MGYTVPLWVVLSTAYLGHQGTLQWDQLQSCPFWYRNMRLIDGMSMNLEVKKR